MPNAARAFILSSMKNRFTAFAVSKGDCFLLELEREEENSEPFRILVDTGDQADEAASLLLKHFATSGAGSRPTLDVVAITHADSDHIRGLAAVLESSVRVLELWLPYQVGRAMTMAFQEPVEIALNIAQLIKNVPDEDLVKAVRQIKYEYLKELECSQNGDDPILIKGADRLGSLLLNKLYQHLEDDTSEEAETHANLSKYSTFTYLRAESFYRRRRSRWADSTNRVISGQFYARWNGHLQSQLGPLELDVLTGSAPDTSREMAS